MTMRVHLGHSSTRCWFDSIDIQEIPRVGEFIDNKGMFRVDQIVWHLGDNPEATIYVTTFESVQIPGDGWDTDIEKAKDGIVKLLTVEREGTPIVVIGGWDNHWTGKSWVYFDQRVPVGTTPRAWKPLPPAMGH
ncbi:hypothetical protein [Phaeobacter phage MD18]|nr:hypothetical protein [Phaeobacter phage MD18]